MFAGPLPLKFTSIGPANAAIFASVRALLRNASKKGTEKAQSCVQSP